MLNITYTITDELRKTLSVIEPLRKEILVTSIPVRVLHKLRWEATVRRVYGSFYLAGRALTRSDVSDTLTLHARRFANSLAQEIVNYRRALFLISFDWLASPDTVSPKTVLTIYTMLFEHTRTRIHPRTIEVLKQYLKEFLGYVNSSSEHPVLIAGTVYASLATFPELSDDKGRLARLVSYLYLYKLGYDIRDLLTIEEPLLANRERVNLILSEGQKSGNLTSWLSFFASSVYESLEKTEKRIATAPAVRETSHIWELSDRQKEILVMLDEPGTSITNKKVQRRFSVSQITSSRDLAKLTSLGLLYPHGRGRSIYYTSA